MLTVAKHDLEFFDPVILIGLHALPCPPFIQVLGRQVLHLFCVFLPGDLNLMLKLLNIVFDLHDEVVLRDEIVLLAVDQGVGRVDLADEIGVFHF